MRFYGGMPHKSPFTTNDFSGSRSSDPKEFLGMLQKNFSRDLVYLKFVKFVQGFLLILLLQASLFRPNSFKL